MAFVNSIDLIAGGNSVHVTVTDQNGNPLPSTDITWNLPVGNSFHVAAYPDSTGFVFTADSSATVSSSTQAMATYSGTGVNNPLNGPELAINVALPAPPPVTITALQYTSP